MAPGFALAAVSCEVGGHPGVQRESSNSLQSQRLAMACPALPVAHSNAIIATSPTQLQYAGLHRTPSVSENGNSFLGTGVGWERSIPTASPNAVRTARARPTTTGALGGMLGGLFGGGSPAEKTRQTYADRVTQINAFESSISQLSDEELKGRTADLKDRVARGESLESVLPEAFAVVREASKRVLGLRPFDVQLIGGMVLHKGEIAEMRTGEGKTLVAVLPAYLNALAGKGVHVVTVNDYLARRDCEWVGQVHRFLGLQVGLIQQGMTSDDRRKNYGCDVTYVTNSELGFDFLRDNLAQAKAELCLRTFSYCIIDEVDSILIDEARTPLIISGSAAKPSDQYVKAFKLARELQRDIHYTVDEKQRSILITEEGYEDAETVLGVKDLYDPREQWASYLLNALKAKELFQKNVNYIVKNKEVVIVDEFTGRVMPGRRWGEGLHQAVEAKEAVTIQNENVTLASISYQNFFLQYPKLCGMTGTAATEAPEFKSIYKLTVTEIPTNRSMVRKDESDVVFRSEDGKWRAAVVEVARMHKTGRPVLVGTTSVEQSEALSERLRDAKIKHQVLNAKPENVEREAEIVAQSGRVGAVTIATNMAGRGTDIILGGNSDFMARLKLREYLMPRIVEQAEGSSQLPIEALRARKKETSAATPIKTWQASAALFPCELSEETRSEIEAAVEAAAEAWGEKALPLLEAEDRLSYACEKGPTSDPVIGKLRNAFQSVNKEYKIFTEREKQQAITAGGLHVVGTERHESRRIDNQLRGRSGRQGDPGSSRFFLSLEDNIFRIFGGDRVKTLMSAFRVGDLPIESKMLTRALDEAQRKVENYFFDARKQLFEYDQVLNSQRDRVYTERLRALTADSLEAQMLEYAELTVDDIVAANIDASKPKETWNLEALSEKMKQYCSATADLTPAVLLEQCETVDSIREYLRARGRQAYLEKRKETEEVMPGLMNDAERYFVLSQTDNLWKDHLQRLRFIQQAVGLRGYAQRDPLIEYKLEGYELFLEMMAQIRRNVIYSVYQFKPMTVKEADKADAQNGVLGTKENGVLVESKNVRASKEMKAVKARRA